MSTPWIDPHIHLWDPVTTPRTVTPAVKLLGWNERLLRTLGPRLFPKAALDFVGAPDHVLHPYFPGMWRRDHASFAVRGFVHVQAGWHGRGPIGSADETRWLEDLCGAELLAIVGHADLAGASLSALLDAHSAASPRFRGVRDMLAYDRDPAVLNFSANAERMHDPAWRRGLDHLSERGLTFDAWMYQPQLASFARILREHPRANVVLDHLGTPIGLGGPVGDHGRTAADRASLASRWHDDLARLAEHPGVMAKISGLTMPILGFGYHARAQAPGVAELVDALGPHVMHAIDVFGADRCMFASNFPMDKVSAPWATIFRAFEVLARDLDEGARAGLFGENAARFYRISRDSARHDEP